jgi:capsular polysaccharide export protein
MDGASFRTRRFLFLQGMANFFFARLAEALAQQGHDVHRVNFNAGDRLFWSLPGSIDFRGGAEDWPSFFERLVGKLGITDVILFGDCRPLHRVARDLAVAKDIDVHVVDEGYLRPNWITFERTGSNGFSKLPKEVPEIRRLALSEPAWTGGLPVTSSFAARAWQDVLYNVAAVLGKVAYPHYRTHRPWHPFVEYAGWLRRFARDRGARARSAKAVEQLFADNAPFYLFPLQLDCDSQIREHSPFRRLGPSIDFVLRSFATHAPAGAKLVLKEHPLDNCLTDWRKQVRASTALFGIEDRVVYLEDTPLEPLMAKAAGIVTVNSTSGIVALAFGKPLIALGAAIYDLPGLTHQGSLDSFWESGDTPDAALFDAFRRVVAGHSQINGGFYKPAALALAVEHAVQRLTTFPLGVEVGQEAVA